MDWVRKLFGKKSVVSKPGVTVSKPPVVMTIREWERCSDDTSGQFFEYGWRAGEENVYTQPWDDRIRFIGAIVDNIPARSVAFQLPNGLGLKAAEVMSDSLENLGCVTPMVLYIPADVQFGQMRTIDTIMGGPASEFMDTIRYIALRMEAKILAIMTDNKTRVTCVVFESRQINYTLKHNQVRWRSTAGDQNIIRKESGES